MLVSVAAACNTAHAIDPNRAMSQYVHDRWGIEQGFPRGAVYAITQTADGYLWIGTDAGLVRFDGWKFDLVKDNSRSFAIESVLGLMPDNEGNLWVRLRGAETLRYRNGTFENAVAESNLPNVTAMSRSREGALLASSSEHGALTYRKGKLETVSFAAELPRSPVISIAQTPEGDIWLGTRDAGLFRIDGGRASAVTKGLPDPKINCLLPGLRRDLWIGTDAGIARWNGTELTASGLPAALKNVQVLAMALDRDGNIWIGTDSRGLLRLNTGGASRLDESADRSKDAVTAIFEDREGNVWSGSANGIERLRDSAFVTHSVSEGLPSERNGPVYVDDDGRTWFAPIGGGLYWLVKGRGGRATEGGLATDVVYSISAGTGELWLGRQRGGLTRLRTDGSGFKAETYTQASGLAQNSVYAVHRSRDGTVWAGTLSGGISRLNSGRFTTYTMADGLASNSVASILEAADGTVWVATPDGLSALAGGRWRTYLARDGLPSEDVNCLLEDSTGALWLGTAGGLAVFRSGGVQVPTALPPSLKEQILGMVEDRNGSLWIATTNHVLRVNRERLLGGALREEDVREYGPADGLNGVEGVKRHRSVVSDPLGQIWFSLNRGLSVVNPRRLANSSAQAIVHIQTISADGHLLDRRGPIRIPSDRQRITFSFAGLSLSVPERIRFRYTLDNFDRGWNGPVSTREAIYTNLSAGSYRFRVVASNAEGIWDSAESAVEFEIDPAFWQTWWFRLSLAVTCILSGWAAYRFRLHQLTRRLNVRFEERFSERTRVAQDLHDTLLQGFLSASMQLHVVDDRLQANSPAKPMVRRVLQLMGQVIGEGRNAVQGLRSPENMDQDLAQAFARIPEEFATREQVDFRVIVEGQPRRLHPVLRDEVYRIGREALVNAFRHSGAKNIEVEIDYAPGQFRILVRDNGCGIDPEVLRAGRDGHWGLPGMRERAERIGARLRVLSSSAAGTELELCIPSHLAFQSGKSRQATTRSSDSGNTGGPGR